MQCVHVLDFSRLHHYPASLLFWLQLQAAGGVHKAVTLATSSNYLAKSQPQEGQFVVKSRVRRRLSPLHINSVSLSSDLTAKSTVTWR
jgi:acyl-coenzyme A thioesterase PaaI-like protein